MFRKNLPYFISSVSLTMTLIVFALVRFRGYVLFDAPPLSRAAGIEYFALPLPLFALFGPVFYPDCREVLWAKKSITILLGTTIPDVVILLFSR